MQPNTSRAHTFAEAFIACGGIETLLVLLQREVKAGDVPDPEAITTHETSFVQESSVDSGDGVSERILDDDAVSVEEEKLVPEKDGQSESPEIGGVRRFGSASSGVRIERTLSISEHSFVKNLGGISLLITADSARNNVYNVDKRDGIVVGIIGLVGALVASGHLKFDSFSPSDATTNILGSGLPDGGSSMFDDKISLLLYALQKTFQAAPNKLMTNNVYTALMGASVYHLVLCLNNSYLPNKLQNVNFMNVSSMLSCASLRQRYNWSGGSESFLFFLGNAYLDHLIILIFSFYVRHLYISSHAPSWTYFLIQSLVGFGILVQNCICTHFGLFFVFCRKEKVILN